MPNDSARFAPVVVSFVSHRPEYSAASSPIHSDGFSPSKLEAFAGLACISLSVSARPMMP